MMNFDISVRRFDEFAAEFAERFMNVESYMDSIERFCELILSEKPEILELGCGPGNVTRMLKQRFPESKITAIDLAPKMIEIARLHLPEIDFRVMDVRNISSFQTNFDAVMCSFCLPFLSETDACQLIADCAGRLVPGGVLYISTMEGDQTRAGFEKTSFSGSFEIYFNYHRQSNLENALLESGFSIEQCTLQDYAEPDGTSTTDMIFIAVKK